MTGALPSGTEITKGIREQEPKSVLDLEKTSAKLQRTSPSCSIAKGVQPGPRRSKATARRCDGSHSQTRRNEACCSGVRRSSRAGEREAVAATATRGGAVTPEAGVTPCGSEKGPEGRPTCCKACNGTLMSGAWATPGRSPGSRFDTPTRGITCHPEATKCSSSKGKSDWGACPSHSVR